MTYWSALIGFFLGFAFGVGCALAVMYSIYMGGYRAAARDSTCAAPPPRWLQATQRAKIHHTPIASTPPTGPTPLL